LAETSATLRAIGADGSLDLTRHLALPANLYEQNGSTLVLAAHTDAQAPAHCSRAANLPYPGAGTGLSSMVAIGLLAAGGLLLATSRRSGSTAV
jgi:hypothetical protein